MDYFEPKTIVIAVSTMVFWLLFSTFCGVKSAIAMKICKCLLVKLIDHRDTNMKKILFPIATSLGGSRVAGARDDDYSTPVENEKQNSLFHQPEQAKFDWDDKATEKKLIISIRAVSKEQNRKGRET